jgi:hypothetical protein
MQRFPAALFPAWTLLLVPAATAAEPRVTIEVATEAGAPITASQQWAKLLGELDVAGVRIRSMRPGDQIEKSERGTGASRTIHVLGILTSRGTLRLPGGTFSLRDRKKLADWLKQSTATPEDPAKRKSSFDLTDAQLADVKKDLGAAVDFSTKGVKLADLVQRIGRTVQEPITPTAAAQQALAAGDVVRDEMKGLSCGTTLAAALRPMGLVLVPRPDRKGHAYVITSGRGLTEIWPVGWPTGDPPAKLVPNIVKVTGVDFQEVAASAALELLQPRLEVPFLLDHNSMAEQGIDLERTAVTVPPARRTYSNILQRVLYPAKMTSELRVDDAGRPLFWMTSSATKK